MADARQPIDRNLIFISNYYCLFHELLYHFGIFFWIFQLQTYHLTSCQKMKLTSKKIFKIKFRLLYEFSFLSVVTFYWLLLMFELYKH